MDRTDIPQKFPISSMFATLKIGKNFATFSCSGKVPSLNEL